ncbi:MAG: hypothetical protein U0232_19675 [Thermomicrobiales bacterium]
MDRRGDRDRARLGASLVLSCFALRPIERIAATARSIEESRLQSAADYKAVR